MPDSPPAAGTALHAAITEFNRRYAARKKRMEAAHGRALRLLQACLSPAQFESYRDEGWFEVTSSRGRTWLIRNSGPVSNVETRCGGKTVRWCAAPMIFDGYGAPMWPPMPDVVLAQALTLITDEDLFVRTAPHTYERVCGIPSCPRCYYQ